MNTNLEWVFDPLPPSNSREGNWAMGHIISPEIDKFVREVLQNARDQMLAGSDGPVDVDFELYELTGDAKAEFLAGMRWDQLRQHIEGAVEGGSVTIRADLERGLESADDLDVPFRVLRIRDRNTKGLVGGDDEPGNFKFLCKDQFITDESENDRGGSFGIGKSVLWRFSQLSTVLFSSVVPRVSGDELDFRLFGRCQLPSHDAMDQGWSGSGWFGAVDSTPAAGQRAVSVWGDDARESAGSLLLARPTEERGTTITVLGFFEPREESPEGRGIEDLCTEIAESSARWFWPSMSTEPPSLRVHVTGYRNDERVFERATATATQELEHFLQLAGNTPLVQSHRWRVTVPGVEDYVLDGSPSLDLSSTALEAEVELRLIELPMELPGLNRKVALIRGSRMVVMYHDPASAVERNYIGLLVAGKALDDTVGSSQLERYLRAAEPPAHDAWEPSTERLRAEFKKRFRRQALDHIWAGIRRHIDQQYGQVQVQSDTVSERFRQMFAISAHGAFEGVLPPASFRDFAHATFDGEVWRVRGRVTRLRGDTQWRSRVSAKLGTDSGGGDTLDVEITNVPDGVTVDGDTLFVPADLSEVAFDARVGFPESLATTIPDLDYVRMQLTVSSKEQS